MWPDVVFHPLQHGNEFVSQRVSVQDQGAEVDSELVDYGDTIEALSEFGALGGAKESNQWLFVALASAELMAIQPDPTAYPVCSTTLGAGSTSAAASSPRPPPAPEPSQRRWTRRERQETEKASRNTPANGCTSQFLNKARPKKTVVL